MNTRIVSPHEIPQLIFALTERCAKIADEIAERNQTEASEPPLVGLNMAHIALVQCFEVLDFYFHRWGNIEQWVIDQHGPEAILEQNEQRVALIQKSTMILIMSSFEAAAKQTLLLPNCPINDVGRRIYLGGIMASSHKAGIIGDTDAALWAYAVELRNCIVHNNGVAERTMKLNLGNGYTLEMVSGAMTQSTPRKSTLLTEAIILAYSRWCAAILEASSVPQ
jgi:hypothetical protein